MNRFHTINSTTSSKIARNHIAGDVAEVGDGVSGFEVGERVVRLQMILKDSSNVQSQDMSTLNTQSNIRRRVHTPRRGPHSIPCAVLEVPRSFDLPNIVKLSSG